MKTYKESTSQEQQNNPTPHFKFQFTRTTEQANVEQFNSTNSSA